MSTFFFFFFFLKETQQMQRRKKAVQLYHVSTPESHPVCQDWTRYGTQQHDSKQGFNLKNIYLQKYQQPKKSSLLQGTKQMRSFWKFKLKIIHKRRDIKLIISETPSKRYKAATKLNKQGKYTTPGSCDIAKVALCFWIKTNYQREKLYMYKEQGTGPQINKIRGRKTQGNNSFTDTQGSGVSKYNRKSKDKKKRRRKNTQSLKARFCTRHSHISLP